MSLGDQLGDEAEQFLLDEGIAQTILDCATIDEARVLTGQIMDAFNNQIAPLVVEIHLLRHRLDINRARLIDERIAPRRRWWQR